MRQILGFMSYELDKNQIEKLNMVLVTTLQEYEIEPSRDLPSTDVYNNEKIINTFLASKKIEGIKNTTIVAYSYTLRKLMEICDRNILEYDTNTVRIFLIELGKTNSQVSVDNHRRNLSSFFEWLVQEEFINKNPVKKIKKIKADKIMKFPFTDYEIVKLKDNASSYKERAMIDLMLSTGVRCSELCSIELSKMDFANNEITVFGKGHKERVVYMNASCSIHIREYLEHRRSEGIQSKYLFCGAKRTNVDGELKYGIMHTGTVQKMMRNLGESWRGKRTRP